MVALPGWLRAVRPLVADSPLFELVQCRERVVLLESVGDYFCVHVGLWSSGVLHSMHASGWFDRRGVCHERKSRFSGVVYGIRLYSLCCDDGFVGAEDALSTFDCPVRSAVPRLILASRPPS